MNWDAIGAIAESIGAVAVIATLLYLAIQIRQNTKSLDETKKIALGNSFQERTNRRISMIEPFITSRELAEIMVKLEKAGYPSSIDSLEVLDDVERRRVRAFHATQILSTENAIYQHELGLIDDLLRQQSDNFAVTMKAIWEAEGLVGPLNRIFKDGEERA